mgnify:CR=1 FL=1
MKTFTEQELKEVLRKHKLWLVDHNQQEAERANLYDADLRGAYLYGADLRGAYLRGADLRGADLRGAYLRDADLRGAYLYDADLRGAYLRGADLRGADLRDADLRDADLRGANLCDAYLYGADLRGADLRDADLRGANLCDADLRDAKNIPFVPYACPDFGAFIGYKKAHGLIVELEILSDAKRVSATGRKCRCNKAKVLSIQNIDGTPSILTSVASDRDSKFIYKVGEIVTVDDFDENRWNECSTGIHFFINRQEAVNY